MVLGLSARNSAWNSGARNAEGMWSNLPAEGQGGLLWSGGLGPEAWANGLEGMLLCQRGLSDKSLVPPALGARKAPCRCGAVFTSLTRPRFLLQRLRSSCEIAAVGSFLTGPRGEMLALLL